MTATPGGRPARTWGRGRRSAVTVLAILALGVPAAAATAAPTPPVPTPAVPASTATAHDQRPAAQARLQRDLQAVVDAGAVGVVAASTTRGGDWWKGAAGVRNPSTGSAAQPFDTVRVGSVTKAMVATLAMQEVDRRHWSLSTTVDDVLPGLLGAHGDVTLEELLSHRSGLPDHLTALLRTAQTPEQVETVLATRRTDQQLVAAALADPWSFTPGTSFSYSNTNYVVVGMMLAAATHRSVGSLLAQRVFAPAGMGSARFPMNGPTYDGAHLSDVALWGDPPGILDDLGSTSFSSAGAVVANASDIDRFYRALMAGRLTSKGSLQQMLTPRTTTPLRYGLGIYAVGDPCPAADGSPQLLFGHDGATFGTLTVVFTSADGIRQASVAYNGRDYSTTTPQSAVAANQVLVDAFTASCPRPVTAGGHTAGERPDGVDGRLLGQAPQDAWVPPTRSALTRSR